MTGAAEAYSDEALTEDLRTMFQTAIGILPTEDQSISSIARHCFPNSPAESTG